MWEAQAGTLTGGVPATHSHMVKRREKKIEQIWENVKPTAQLFCMCKVFWDGKLGALARNATEVPTAAAQARSPQLRTAAQPV